MTTGLGVVMCRTCVLRQLVPSVEVKAERADPYLAMQPTTEERSSVAAIIQATGLRAVEALTALRASENDVRVAIK